MVQQIPRCHDCRFDRDGRVASARVRRVGDAESEVSLTRHAHLAGTAIQTWGLQTPDQLLGSCCVANVRRGVHVGAVSSVTGCGW
jgi:hypothetical protein